VMFFKPAVDLLRKSGHELLCTSRHYREAVDLAKIQGLNLKIVGRHGGSERYEKLQESAKRIHQLAYEIRKFKPDIAITFSSPEGARVAFGLGIKHIGFNDSPHAEAVAKLTIPLMDHLFSPWLIPNSAWAVFGISKKNITRYRALDPAAWLKRCPVSTSPARVLANKLKLDMDKKSILIRIEESKASYIADKNLEPTTSMVDSLVKNFSKLANVLILCRYEDQLSEITKKYKGKAHVIQKVMDGRYLISLCDVFIGAGGTMTSEASLLGKPTISMAPLPFYVERYLVVSGLVKRACNSKNLIKLTREMIMDNGYATKQKKKAKRILDKMDDPVDKILSYVEKLA
jgi:uncharacterized protein